MNALKTELQFHAQDLVNIQSVYLGGGTPSSLSLPLMRPFLLALQEIIDLPGLAEFTIEANPTDVTDEWISLLKEFGVNRVSLGVQSFSDALLKAIGRTHSSKDAITAIQKLKDAGFSNLSIDLIYALPGETLEDLKFDLEIALRLEIQHLSIYSLILEEKTELHHLVESKKISLPSEEEEENMAEWIEKRLSQSPFNHYEISNYGLPGFFSKHNLLYWNLDEYIGIGLGAASQYHYQRFVNYETIRKYIDNVKNTSSGVKEILPFDEIQETLLLGLRKAEGVSKTDFTSKFNKSVYDAYPGLKKHLHNGLLVDSDDRIHLTEKGFLLSNQVLIDLF